MVTRPYHTITAVEGTSVRIPCSQFHRILHPRRVRLVLWFKDNGTDPIKSLDSRERARLTGLPVDSRLTSADLQLTPVSRRHSGRYRCRVDAEDDPTEVSWVTLTVHDAPVTPSLKIYNQYKDDIGGTDIHVVEYSSLQVICRIINGDQIWHITWSVRRAGEQDQFLTSETDRATSEQRLEYNVTRADDSAALLCRARTTTGEDLNAEVGLKIAYGPDTVSLQCAPNSTSAGQEVTCSCSVLPSRPQYQVTWLWGADNVSGSTQHNSQSEVPPEMTTMTSRQLTGITSHQLTRVTSRHDDGRQVTCQAVNPISGQRRQAVGKLSVLYVPELVLSGPSYDLVEGDDAHFSCFVRARPPAQFTYWLHNDRELVSSERVVVGPQLLIVRSLTPGDSGRYACFANNSLGGALSNTLRLKLKYVPVCRSEAISQRHAALNRATFVSCRVRARPRPSAFQWAFQPAAGEPRSLPSTAHSDKGHSSVLRWTPRADSDYGQLLCRAANALGRQQEPCRFDILPPAAPEAVQNCSLSVSGAVISCVPGADRGLTPWYTLCLYGPNQQLVTNVTENRPLFNVPLDILSAGEHTAEVVAETAAGQSRPVQLRFRPHPSFRRQTDASSRFSVNAWVLGSAIFALLAVVALVILSVHVRCHCTPGSGADSHHGSTARPELTHRSFSAQQPIYAEVQRRRPSPRPQPAVPPRLNTSHWDRTRAPAGRPRTRTPQPPERSRTPQPPERSRSRTPQPPERSRSPQPPERGDREPPTERGYRERSRTTQPSDLLPPGGRNSTPDPPDPGYYGLNDHMSRHLSECQRTWDRNRDPQRLRRPGERSNSVQRCRSLPVPPPKVAHVRGRSLQPGDAAPPCRRQDETNMQTTSQSNTEPRYMEPELPAEDTAIQVHLQPPSPASTASTQSTGAAVDQAAERSVEDRGTSIGKRRGMGAAVSGGLRGAGRRRLCNVVPSWLRHENSRWPWQ